MDEKKLNKNFEDLRDRFKDVMVAADLAWWEMELPSGEVEFNDKKAEMLGYSPDRFSHYSDFTDLIHPEDYDRAMKAMRDHLDGKEDRYEVEYRIQQSNGDYKWLKDVGGLIKEEDEYKKITGIVIDIDDRKQEK